MSNNTPIQRHRQDLRLPCATLGTRREIPVFHYGKPGARPKAYLQTGLHADETPGRLVLQHLRALLEGAADQGRMMGEVILVPTANPIGLDNLIGGRLVGRFALNGEGNFNRGWPDVAETVAQSVGPQLSSDSEQNVRLIRQAVRAAAADLAEETQVDALKKHLFGLAADADIALDLHCDERASLHVYLGTPLWPDARDLCAYLGSVATLLETASGGSPFDEAVGGIWWRLQDRFPDHPIPAACVCATVELRGEQDVSEELASQDAAGLFAFLIGRGVVAGDPGPQPELLSDATPLAGVDMPKAPHAGVLTYIVAPGTRVREGEVVARLADPDAANPGQRTEIRTKTSGVVFACVNFPMISLGQILCKVAGATPLPDRKPGQLLTD